MSINTYIRSCERNMPGNMYLFVTEASNVYDVTVTNGEVSDIVMNGGETFKQIQADVNGIVRLIQKGGEEGKTFYNHFVNFVCGRASKELNDLSDQLSEASSCGIIAIVMDANSQAWMIGWNEYHKNERGLFLRVDEFTSGRDMTQAEGGKRRYQLFNTSDYLDYPTNANINQYILDCISAGEDVGFTP